MEALSIELPWPPSVNRYYRVFRNRVIISRDGHKYRMMLVSRLGGTKPLAGELALTIHLYPPDKRRRDIDNIFKCTLDALVHAGVMHDDSQIKILYAQMREPTPNGKLRITLQSKESYVQP